MKIKLPFTEKFLLDLYNFMNKAGRLIGKITLPKYFSNPAIAFKKLFLPSFCDFMDEWENKYKNKKKKDKNYFYRMIYQLKQRGYLKILRVKNNSAIIITPKGIEKIFIAEIKLIDRKPRRDRKWQMVLFDIPENKRRNRDLFRRALQYLGYKKLQKSIWVCPYDVLRETKDLIKRYNLKPYVELLLVKKIGLG